MKEFGQNPGFNGTVRVSDMTPGGAILVHITPENVCIVFPFVLQFIKNKNELSLYMSKR